MWAFSIRTGIFSPIFVTTLGLAMLSLDKEKQELMEEIKLLGYESLRFSIFNDHRPRGGEQE